jgi:hypothetical protein
MKIQHPEKAITKIVNGKKFTTYGDGWVQDLGKFECPCCSKEMNFNEGKEQMTQGVLTATCQATEGDCRECVKIL